MPLLDTTGNNTADAYQGGSAVVSTYIEDVFSTYLYTGTGASQSIVNGIDLSTKGGLTWIKSRSAATDHKLTDTVRGVTKALVSSTTDAQTTDTTGLTAFGTTGFTVGANTDYNTSASTYVSWTFRKQPKFFDIVTYTGNGGTQTLSHNLQSTPGCIIVKATNDTESWIVWHNAFTSGQNLQLNTAGGGPYANGYFATLPTSTQFTLSNGGYVNGSGVTYVAYIFAHNAGGFGLLGTDNVITCGSFTTNGTVAGYDINLGYEPQWVMIKRSDGASDWVITDVMRGWNNSGQSLIWANLSNAEYPNYPDTTRYPTAIGFHYGGLGGESGTNYIYIAIRRGPMSVPTDATNVFLPSTFVGSNSVNKAISTKFTVDMTWGRARNASVSMEDFDRLRGAPQRLVTDSATAEVSAQASNFDVNNGITLLAGYDLNYSTLNFVNYTFGRAPSFFDEVCYTGNSVAGRTITHNLGVTPEIVLIKNRGDSRDWILGTPSVGWTKYLQINQQDAPIVDSTIWNNTAPTSSVFTIGNDVRVNTSYNYVAYLFATCAGVSKVGTYTGNGTTQTINCGFTSGARFVLIRQTNTTGDWYVYDTARGMTTLTDPYLFTNTTAAETATLGSVTTVSTGFALNSSIVSAINVSGGSYIFLAIA